VKHIIESASKRLETSDAQFEPWLRQMHKILERASGRKIDMVDLTGADPLVTFNQQLCAKILLAFVNSGYTVKASKDFDAPAVLIYQNKQRVPLYGLVFVHEGNEHVASSFDFRQGM